MNWPTVNVTPDQSGTSPSVNCEIDFRNAYLKLQPEIERKGLSMRYTANVDEDTQFYAMANYYLTDTYTTFTPLGFNGRRRRRDLRALPPTTLSCRFMSAPRASARRAVRARAATKPMER